MRGDRAPSTADPTRVEGSPKWPQHALLVRYVRARWLRWLRWLATAAAAVMAWRRWRQWRRGPIYLECKTVHGFPHVLRDRAD